MWSVYVRRNSSYEYPWSNYRNVSLTSSKEYCSMRLSKCWWYVIDGVRRRHFSILLYWALLVRVFSRLPSILGWCTFRKGVVCTFDVAWRLDRWVRTNCTRVEGDGDTSDSSSPFLLLSLQISKHGWIFFNMNSNSCFCCCSKADSFWKREFNWVMKI